MTAFLYFACIMVWGSSWIAIQMQLGDVPILASIFYRFVIAALLLLPCLIIIKKLQKTKPIDHLWFVGQGVCFFSLNFLCFYHATQYIPSGIVAIIFSTVLLFNSINRWLFLHQNTSLSEFAGMFFGVAGIILLFWRELTQQIFGADLFTGILFALLGTLIFSFGNMISIRNSSKGITPLTSNGYSMGYGALILLLAVILTGTPFKFSFTYQYILSLLYLSAFASVLGFTIYLTLVNKIGINKAAYCMVAFPVVAILISTLFEDFHWDPTTFSGVGVIIFGNFLMVSKLEWRIKKPSREQS
ncbi:MULTISPECIES: DMT family transporter [Halomonadaceae]|uniref:DMT family transporter n=1 Tax=Halomonadaceae TaxID=28256 RepID=UPI000BC361CC|nr:MULTISPECIES: DMT family transporter [Halomonas]ATH77179.1 EamA family transporter [Halomonas hydrothermalis]NGO90589.1 EamA family transporter [Halomonas sp.]NQY78189.1 DMT family transporter [Halomonas sp.]PJX12556.1 EamA/RhaT family transporter [Halomonas sp. 141]UDM07253.1 DMT family transporter [Halomonas sp. NyZ770]|tara:strand:+ start:282 stop:1184 length:903 start_codon:yes stop_codon:yes gene_type:complete